MNQSSSIALKKKPSKLLIFSIVSVVSGLILGYFGRNIFSVMFAILIFWFVFVPSLFGFVICSVIETLQKKENQVIPKLHSAFKTIMVVTIILSSTIAIVGLTLFSNDIEKAEAFCTELVEKIEFEKEKMGGYPLDIQALLKNYNKPPRFIDKRRLYIRDDAGYELRFTVTGGLFPRLYVFRSNTRKWEILD